MPLYVIAMKLGPALAAGCTVIVKAAPETALDPYGLMDAVQDAGLPPGVLNILSAGRETSEYLVKHPGIDKVSFTGSTATGQRIGEICGSQIKRCTLELDEERGHRARGREPRDRGASDARRGPHEQRPGLRRADPLPGAAQALQGDRRRDGRPACAR